MCNYLYSAPIVRHHPSVVFSHEDICSSRNNNRSEAIFRTGFLGWGIGKSDCLYVPADDNRTRRRISVRLRCEFAHVGVFELWLWTLSVLEPSYTSIPSQGGAEACEVRSSEIPPECFNFFISKQFAAVNINLSVAISCCKYSLKWISSWKAAC